MSKRSDKGHIWLFLLLFVNFFKSGLITFLYVLYTASLGMILINCQEMDFIELFKRSFSRSERSGLAHFPILIDVIQ